jgi:hypothetical protein
MPFVTVAFWTVAATTFALAVLCLVLFLAVRPTVSDQVFCSLGSSTACNDWRQATIVHLTAMYVGLGLTGVMCVTGLVAAILTFAD